MGHKQHYDLIVVGGGINGVGIAADAQGRGLSVLLCEQNDLASATSSRSSKMIHGGLRYVAQGQFSLVKESLQERHILTQLAPHLVQPQSFIIPHRAHHQPFWMIRAGLYFYDFFGARKPYARSRVMSLKNHPLKNTLHPDCHRALTYSDATVDDARLVITNALRFKELGGDLYTRTACIDAKSDPSTGRWNIILQNTQTQQTFSVTAKALVNATGPWVNNFIKRPVTPSASASNHTCLVKGSHIIIRNPYSTQQAFLLPHEDGRVIFVIPYRKDFTLIGTTDIAFEGDPSNITISDEEIQYLIDITNRYLTPHISPTDIVHSWSGVRTLIKSDKNPSKNSREYKLDCQQQDGAILLNVYGGKLTTYRSLSEKAVNIISHYFQHARSAWTRNTPLPGGFLDKKTPEQYLTHLYYRYPWLQKKTVDRYFNQFGSRIHDVLKRCAHTSDLGKHFGHDVYEKELQYFMTHEWALTLEDIIWRRTQLGLVLTEQQKVDIGQWLAGGLTKVSNTV